MNKIIVTLVIFICSFTNFYAQTLKFMNVLMGSTSANFQEVLLDNGFAEPVRQGSVDFYKNGKFEDKNATVAIYNNDSDKINRIVVYIEIENDVEATSVIKDLGDRFKTYNKSYILKDLSQNGKILHIFSKKDDYGEYIAIEFNAGEKKINIQFILAQ